MRGVLDQFVQDLRYALRQIHHSPGFAAVAILSLALGLGATTTVYSIAHSLLDRPLDVVHPEEVVRVYRGRHSPLPRDWYLHFAAQTQTLAGVIAEDPMPVGVGDATANQRAIAAVVSENFFSVLGVGPALGAVFSGAPMEPVGRVTVLSHDYWMSRFGGDSGIVGRTIRLNDLPFTVAGVARAGFHSSQYGWPPSLFVPLSEQAALRGVPAERAGQSSLYVTGRLASGRSREEAHAELVALSATLPDASPEALRGGFRVEHARGITEEVRGPAAGVSVFLLFVVGVVLLIACANLANLLLARATARRREIAIRLAMGIGRGRLVRQLLAESVLLALLAGGVGALVAAWLTRLIPTWLPAQEELRFDFAPDATVFGVTVLVAVTAGVLFGLVPALLGARADVQHVLRVDGGRATSRSRWRNGFLTAQVALATLLLMTAGLFLRGLHRAGAIDSGYIADRVVDLRVDLSLSRYDAPRRQTFFRDVLDRVRAIPQVEHATLTADLPLSGSKRESGILPGTADPADRQAIRGTTFNVVGPDYFAMFGIPMVAGRAFDAGDREGGPPVVVVNETLAEALWPGASAVGRTVRFDDQVFTVVGVARDVKYSSLAEEGTAFTYFPLSQSPLAAMVLQVRLTDDAPGVRQAVRSAVQELDPALPLGGVTRFRDDMEIALLPVRAGTGLLATFGLLALFLAVIGLHGVTAYVVALRTSEIGIRTALGARAGQVFRLIFSETGRLVGLGLGLGLVGGAGIGKLLANQVYGVSPLDPPAVLMTALLLLGGVGLAVWVPVRRALSVDPVIALRVE